MKHIEKSLGKLGADYAGKPMGIVAISANDAATYPDDGPAGLKQQAKTNGFVFPYLLRRIAGRGEGVQGCVHARPVSYSTAVFAWFIAANTMTAGPATEFP